MRAPLFRLPAIAVAALALGSCSYVYRVVAVVIDGRLAFIVDPSEDNRPRCIDGINISVNQGETARAKPVAGDDQALVANGVYWAKSLEMACQNSFPIFYGQRLRGRRLVYNGAISGRGRGELSSSVAAKPLRVGIVYEVSTSGDGGYGSGWFRIRADRRVETWARDPAPAVVDAQGEDVPVDYDRPPSPSTNRH